MYRKIEISMHADERFRRLTRSQPCGQALWYYLLTCPESLPMPGVIRAWEPGMAASLGWPMKGFRDAMREVIRDGMLEADFGAGLLWLPKALKHNPPQSVNVVISWRDHWPIVTECQLKVRIWQHFKAYFDGMSDAYREAYAKACPKPYLIQEQEQEQEQEEDLRPSPKAPTADVLPDKRITEIKDHFRARYEAKVPGVKFLWGPVEGARAKALLARATQDVILSAMDWFFSTADKAIIGNGYGFKRFAMDCVFEKALAAKGAHPGDFEAQHAGQPSGYLDLKNWKKQP